MNERWKCLLCGRDKFNHPGQPHYCNGEFRVHHFNRDAKRKGLEKAFARIDNKEDYSKIADMIDDELCKELSEEVE